MTAGTSPSGLVTLSWLPAVVARCPQRPRDLHCHRCPPFVELWNATPWTSHHAATPSVFDGETPLVMLSTAWKELENHKMQMTADYTAESEAATEGFLREQYSFVADALPWDYLSEPPSDLTAVEANWNCLQHVLAEAFLSRSAVTTRLIEPFVQRVWRVHLHPFREKLVSFQRRLAPFLDSSHPSVLAMQTSCERDLNYVDTIFRLEPLFCSTGDELLGGTTRGELQDHVPVSGLLLGKLHRLENEHRTALAHWTRHRADRKT